MRIIKFRAWLIDEKKMVEWTPQFFSDMSPVTGYSDEFPFSDEDVVLMLFTGLLDRHGKEIYEGDICKRIPCGTMYRVVFYPPKFTLECLTEHFFHYRDFVGHTWEVIGNVYENPELVK